jgi:hypothetical protein
MIELLELCKDNTAGLAASFSSMWAGSMVERGCRVGEELCLDGREDSVT